MARARHIYSFGSFQLIPEERQLLRDGEPVSLTPKAFDLLVALVSNAGHLVEKDELMKLVWADTFVEEANLSVKMSSLRRALGEGANENQYVETVPRRGYRFVAPVTERWEEHPIGAGPGEEGPKPIDAPSPPSEAPVVAARSRRLIGGLLLLLLLSVLLLAFSRRGVRERLTGRPDAVRIHSLAVLPLENVSGDAPQDYFADGMTDALIAELARSGTVRVSARPSSMRYKGSSRTPSEIGGTLGVDAVLAGSAARLGDRVRISVQVIHRSSGRTLWDNSYERDLRDVLQLQREVARDIVLRITGELPRERSDARKVRQVAPEAYDQYLRGQFYLHRQNKEDNEAAIAALEKAVEADPEFAGAHAELAQAYVWKLFLFAPGERQWEEKAFVSAEKALALDPELAAAYLARGRVLWTPANRFPHEKAIREYRRALTLNPSLDEARNQLALIYCHIGAFDEALEEARTSAILNPSNSLAQFRMAQVLNFQGKHEQALSILRSLPDDVNPALIGQQSGWALFNLGRKDEAAAVLARLLEKNPEDAGGVFTSLQAVIAASNGDQRATEEKIDAAVKKGQGFGHFHHTAYQIGCAYALLNRNEEAIKWLRTAAEDGFPCYPLFQRDPNLNNLRKNPDFIALMTSMRQQWERYRTVL